MRIGHFNLKGFASRSSVSGGPQLWLLLCLAFWSMPASHGQQTIPGSDETEIAAGVQALKTGDLERAEEAFNRALRSGVRHPLIFHNLGVIAEQRGNYAQAVTRFRQALELEPNYGPSRLLLGSSLLASGRNANAVLELRRAVQLMPQQPEARLELARAFEATGNWIGACQELQKLVDSKPDDPEYAYQLGKAYAKLSGWSYQQIAKIAPNSARLHQALGQEYAIQGKYDQALAEYRKAATADATLPEIHLGMAVILLELKKLDEARAQVELELKLVPESKAAEDTRAKIIAAQSAAKP